MALNIAILGAGITGLTTALALTKHLQTPMPNIQVLEVRSAPSTIGGAVNLTPKALRYLDHLGVYRLMLAKNVGAECKTIDIFDLYSGKKSCAIDFRGPDGRGIGKEDSKKYFARRVMRWQLQEALLEAVKSEANVQVVYGKKTTKIEKIDDESINLTFEDGGSMTADLLLGCDGIHSAARTLLVERDRTPKYTGISVVMATTKVRPETKLRWETTGLSSSRKGSFMCSYYEPTKTEQYIVAVIEVAEVASREGWKVRGSDQKAIKSDILSRFKCENMKENEELIQDAGEWTLYPVYALPPKGKWTSPSGRCILLGDSAHAMPPQGESTGICIEDAIIFSRALMQHETKSLKSIFAAYENFRRPHVDAAYQAAAQRWETIKDNGWLLYQLKWFITPWFIWWTAESREAEFAEDYSDLELQIDG